MFCNKIWQSASFCFMNFPKEFKPTSDISSLKLGLADKWMLTKLSQIMKDSNTNILAYDFGQFANDMYAFWLNIFCDVYIEVSKIALYGEDEEAKFAARNVLFIMLDNGLRLFSVMMPFITEEIW